MFVEKKLEGQEGLVYLLESSFFWKVNSEKVNYFLMFSSIMKNKLENTFQCLVMSNELKNNLLMFYLFQVY